MDYLWSPWRYQYIKSGKASDGCVFCAIAASAEDDQNLVVYRGEKNYVVLNRFPYTSGHAMVIPYEHLATLESAPPFAKRRAISRPWRRSVCKAPSSRSNESRSPAPKT